MLSMYVVAETYESGESLLSLIQWNWQVFDDDLNEDKQGALLEEIANSNWTMTMASQCWTATELYMRSLLNGSTIPQ